MLVDVSVRIDQSVQSLRQLSLVGLLVERTPKFLYIQSPRLRAFLPWWRLEGEGHFAADEPVVGVAVSTWHDSSVLYVIYAALSGKDVVQQVPMLGSRVLPGGFIPVFLLEHSVGDGQLML